MRLLELRLSPFGVFDDLALPFRAGRVHVVYGPNEAGKSTCHAALVGHFFGWSKPKKDSMHVAHVRGALSRVSARWKPREGQSEVHVVRLAGQKVVDERGQEQPEGSYEASFAPFGKADFETFFALDHGALRDGGSLLGDKSGSLRDALFAAARSGADIRRVHGELVAEEEALFKPRARVLQVNRAVAAMKAATDRARELSSPPEKWDLEAQGVAAAARAREQLSGEHAELGRDVTRLGTIRKLLECVATLARVEASLASLPAAVGPAPTDPASTRARILELEEARREAEARASAAHTQLELLRPQLQSARAASTFAAHVEAAREARAAALDLARLAEGLDAEDPASTTEPPDEARLQPLEQALQQLARSNERLARLAELDREQAAELARVADGAAAPAPSALELRGLERRALEQEAAREHAASLRAQHQKACSELDARAGFADAHARLTELSLPTREEAREMVAQLKDHEAEALRAEQALARSNEQMAALGHDLELLLKRAPVPREEDLLRVRQQRDRLAERALAGEAVEHALLAAIREADAMVDAMRRAADRIAERLAKEEELERARRRHEQLVVEATAAHARAAAARAPLEARLAALPGAARSALELESWAALREIGQKLVAEERELARLERTATPLESSAAEYAARAARAEAAERAHALFTARREELRAARSRTDHERVRAEAEQAEAALSLQRCAHALGRGESDAGELESWMREARTERHNWERAHARGEERARTLRAIAERQKLLGERLPRLGFATDADDALQQRPEAIAAAIDERVHAALRAEERAGALEREVLAVETAQRLAEAEHNTAHTELAELLRRVQQPDATAAARWLQVEAERQQLLAAAAAERALAVRIAAPADPEPLLAEAAGYEPESLERRIAEKRARLAEVDVALDQARREEARRKAGLEQMSKADHTASLALFEAEEARAEAVALATRWATARLGVTLLHRALERYRQEHQDPVLARASEAFEALTEGRYRRIVPELGDGKDKLRLAVERDDGSVHPASTLSEGTRDQLYLAMRFGTLEARAEHGALPLPIVLDDVFVNFDDQRTRAGLARLAALVRLTDVVYFTHHERVVELAERALPKDLIDVVRLPAAPRSG